MIISIQNSSSLGRSRGLSLIELMIAMTLGLVIVGAISWVYLNAVRSYKMQDNLARIQENARFAFETIGNDLRMTGTIGCGLKSNANALNFPADWYKALFTQPIISTEQDGAAGTETEFSDVLRVLRADISNEHIVTAHDSATNQFTLSAAPNLATGDLVVAVDCSINRHAAVFQASGVAGNIITHAAGGTPGNATNNLGEGGAAIALVAGSRLYPLSAVSYYVALNPRNIPALYRTRPMGASATLTSEELIEGVEDLQVSYGVDTSATADRAADYIDTDADGDPYLRGDQINTGDVPGAAPEDKWARVVSVRISLLMQTPENNVIPSAQTYLYNGTTTTAGDRRLRKVFTHVVKLRNR